MALLANLVEMATGARPTPEEVVEAFLALHSPDVKKYSRTDGTAEFKLGTSGREEVRRKYQPLFAKTPRVQLEIVSLTSLGAFVASRDNVSGFPDGHVSHELAIYQVQDGLIRNIWYIERIVA